MKRYLYFSVFLYILFLIYISVCLYEAGTEIVFKVELTKSEISYTFIYLHYVQKNRNILFLKSDESQAVLYL